MSRASVSRSIYRGHVMWLRSCLCTTVTLVGLFHFAAIGGVADAADEEQRAKEALSLCKTGAKEYRLYRDGENRDELQLKPEPILNWSNPSVGSIHGSVFLWTHHGRPAAVASIFKWFEPLDQMACEVHSLSDATMVAMQGDQEAWSASAPGVKFRPVPTASVASDRAITRLAEMRAIARDISITKTDRDKTQQELRLLTQPLHRYESPTEDVVDGAIFAFVQGTDPEVLLLLEARKGAAGATWQYALVRMNSVIFNARYQDKTVWQTEQLPWNVVLKGSEPYRILNLDRLNAQTK
jgi:hypothetical protein